MSTEERAREELRSLEAELGQQLKILSYELDQLPSQVSRISLPSAPKIQGIPPGTGMLKECLMMLEGPSQTEAMQSQQAQPKQTFGEFMATQKAWRNISALKKETIDTNEKVDELARSVFGIKAFESQGSNVRDSLVECERCGKRLLARYFTQHYALCLRKGPAVPAVEPPAAPSLQKLTTAQPKRPKPVEVIEQPLPAPAPVPAPAPRPSVPNYTNPRSAEWLIVPPDEPLGSDGVKTLIYLARASNPRPLASHNYVYNARAFAASLAHQDMSLVPPAGAKSRFSSSPRVLYRESVHSSHNIYVDNQQS